jgi:hypothetical protein
MRFRILNDEELKALEQEFIQFLVVNHVYAEEWKQINQSEPDKAIQLVELFSDQVLLKVYEKIQYLEFRSKDSLILFYCGNQKIALISVQSKDDKIDLSTAESIHEALTSQVENLTFFKNERVYTMTREDEIHRLIDKGCIVSTADFWNAMNEAVRNEQ